MQIGTAAVTEIKSHYKQKLRSTGPKVNTVCTHRSQSTYGVTKAAYAMSEESAQVCVLKKLHEK